MYLVRPAVTGVGLYKLTLIGYDTLYMVPDLLDTMT